MEDEDGPKGTCYEDKVMKELLLMLTVLFIGNFFNVIKRAPNQTRAGF
jgi:hypothetical protein